MANKYSKYQIRPAVSNYVDPNSVKVNEVLRARYDENKSQKDLLDRTLAGINTLQGDNYIIENAKSDIRNQLSDIVSSGAYENAGLLIQDAITDLAGNKGVQAAQMSYQNRQKELEWITQQRQAGVEVLDFGRFKGSDHRSYVQNEDGTYTKNIYQPMSTIQLDYDKKMKSMFSSMKANSWGINAKDADTHMLRMYGAYIGSTEGKQDFKRLVELEYDQSIPFEKRKQMAEMDIKKRMQAFARAHMHTKVDTSGQKSTQEYLNGQMRKLTEMIGGVPTIQTGNVSVDAGGVGKPSLSENTTLKLASGVAEDIKNGNTKDAADKLATQRRIGSSLLRRDLITKEQHAAFTRNNIELFDLFRSAGGFTESKARTLEAYIKYATTNAPFGNGVGLDPYQAEATENSVSALGNVAAPAAGISLTAGALNLLGTNLPTGAWKYGAGFAGGYAVAQFGTALVGRMFDQRGNVRRWNAPQDENSVASNLGIDTEMQNLMENLSDIDHLNTVFDLKGDDEIKEKDINLLKTVGSEYLEYMYKHGDAIDDIMDDNGGAIVDYATEIPDISTKEGKAGMAVLDNIVDRLNARQVRIMHYPEDSDEWNELTADGTQLRGFAAPAIIPASVVENTPTRISVIREGNNSGKADTPLILEPKAVGDFRNSIAFQFAKETGQLQYAVLEYVQRTLQDVERPSMNDLNNAMLIATQEVAGLIGLQEQSYINAAYYHAMELAIREHSEFMPAVRDFGRNIVAGMNANDPNLNAEYDETTMMPTNLDATQIEMFNKSLKYSIWGTTGEDGKPVNPNAFINRRDLYIR